MNRRLVTVMAAAAFAFTAASAQSVQPGQPAMQPQKMMHHGKKPRGMRSVFLIRHGLPHYSMILMKMWDNPKLALTPEQKMKLKAVRKETMRQVMQTAPQIKELRKKIVKGSRNGAKAESLYAEVDKLAALEAELTKVQLRCIDRTKKILTPAQLAFVQKHIRHGHRRHRERMKAAHSSVR